MGRIAAIDYGLKRIGLAVSDKERRVALPVDVIEGGKKAIQNIKAALPLKEVDLILIGLGNLPPLTIAHRVEAD